MKFACFSDTHETRPYVDLDKIEADYVLHAGDMYDRLSWGMTPTAFEDVQQWASHKDRLRVVRGNHDVLDPADIFKHCDMTGRIEELRQDLYLVGLGWHGQHFYDLPLEKDMAKVCKEIWRQACFKIPNGAHTIILTHYPAYVPDVFPNLHGRKPAEGWFFECITNACEAFRPIAVVQGHIHGLMGSIGWKDGTMFVFPGTRGGMLTIDTDILEAKATFEKFKCPESP